MIKKILKIGFIILLAFFVLSFFDSNETMALTKASDTLSISGPSAFSNHTIKFLTTKPIPPLGKIVITPESGFFYIPAGFDYEDIDIATSSQYNSGYLERSLSNSASAVFDGVSAIASSTNGNITIVLNSSFGIDQGVYVKIKLGDIATFGSIGDTKIKNPSSIGSYDMNIYTYDNSDIYIERGMLKVAIVRPITMSSISERKRSEGAPSGWLANGTTETILSLLTNYEAYCRYSTASNTPYNAMPYNFEYVGGNRSTYHTVLLTGLVENNDYLFYVRCQDDDGISDYVTQCVYTTGTSTIISSDCLDYPISFSVSTVEGGVEGGTGDGGTNIDEEDGSGGDTGSNTGSTGTGASGGGGGGTGGGTGNEKGRDKGYLLPYPPLPGQPGVGLLGYAYPNSPITVLKDGNVQGTIYSNVKAEFSTFLVDLTQGVYTFSVNGEDLSGRKSITYSTTFWIDDGTQTTVSDIILSPTMEIDKTSLTAGDVFNVSGQSVPSAKVEVWVYLKNKIGVSDSEIIKKEITVAFDGQWQAQISTAEMAKGNYVVKARTNITGKGSSEFSQFLEFALDSTAEVTSACEGADLNKDGKVNITDFSILLYYWGTDNDCADQNNSGNVDLIDFSIMMYYWTG